MLNFAVGFFGVPDYQTDFNMEITIEADGFSNSGAPYDTCPNSNNARGSVGSTAASAFIQPWFNKTAERLNTYVSGNLSFLESDVESLMELCAYETVALGYSSFCPLFTEEEFEVFEQYYDLQVGFSFLLRARPRSHSRARNQFHGNSGFGSPVGAAQGLGYLQELVSRLNHTLITDFNAGINATLDGSNVTFPLNQSIYADAAHEVAIMNALVALNLTSLVGSAPPSNETLSSHTFVASKVVPFAMSLQIQVMECQPSVPTKQIRFIVK
ncbi:SPOSA6832_03431 [Sporobolomyces salmonicolor]|uniref:SPOSA6832_03431-mRNA-1:cds n=1 Tax=Sporidiobolus salmonicolor TaxID=5005 RepID=A0A0D6ENR2_SPOSA|nr:SPOSA6832_03431 [Sporobolomyces salmonicolor]